MLDYDFITVWKITGENKTSSLSDEIVRITESDNRVTYFIPYGSDIEYLQCNSHAIKVINHEEFVKEYSTVRKFYETDYKK